MKNLLHFIGSLLLFAATSIVIAILYGGLRYLLYLFSIVDKPTWSHVFGMAFLLWVLMILYGLWNVIITAYRHYKNKSK
jgi:hypothetical protein